MEDDSDTEMADYGTAGLVVAASNAASEGCHSTRQLVMSDKQTGHHVERHA